MAAGERLSSYTLDDALLLHDGAAALTSSDVGQVDGADKIVDLGGAEEFGGDLVVDISAIDEVSNDEAYEVILEGSDSSTFASGIEAIARMKFGPNETLTGGTDVDTDIGRYAQGFHNNTNGRSYQYLRLNVIIAGTSPSITFQAYIAKSKIR